MIADLHCHYPMRVLAEEWGMSPTMTYDKMRQFRGRRSPLDRVRVLLLKVLALKINYPGEEVRWRVDLDGLEKAEARLVLSVLYVPWSEFDIHEAPQGEPDAGYFEHLIRHLEQVEDHLLVQDPDKRRHCFISSTEDLDAAGDKVGFVHCVEGGFHLGDPDDVERNITELKRRGVAYVTLAHLFYRRIATNVNSLPISNKLYDRVFCQPDTGLSTLGRRIVREMYRQRILIDVSHMRAPALKETFGLLDELDAEFGFAENAEAYPVLASHAGFRIGENPYMLDEWAVRQIERRGGIIGLILGAHLLQDGLSDDKTEKHTAYVLSRHISAIRTITDSCDNIGIGSDLDGFIKPTMAGFETASDLAKLKDMIGRNFPDDVDAILYKNARRVVEKALAAPLP